MKTTYLQGVKQAERMYQSGYTFTELRDFIDLEEEVGGSKWANWSEGFRDGIEHFERLEGMTHE